MVCDGSLCELERERKQKCKRGFATKREAQEGSGNSSYKIPLTLTWTLKPLQSFMRMTSRTD